MMISHEAIENRPFVSSGTGQPLEFLWLEITGKCNLECIHCYADSSPRGTHGSMSFSDWCRVLDQAASLGCKTVQFIGGEPTLHPDFAALVRKAKDCGLDIEVYSNLVSVPESFWELFRECGVHLATSFYSDDPSVQDAITQRPGSQQRTLYNIARAGEQGHDIRVGLIAMDPMQDIDRTTELLEAQKVTSIKLDHIREVGRGQKKDVHNFDALCGNCSGPVASIDPEGQVYPCVFSRWLPVGNVREESLSSILDGTKLKGTRSVLDKAFSLREDPEVCHPNYCQPYLGAPDGNPGPKLANDSLRLTCTPCPPNAGGCVPDCNPYCSPMMNKSDDAAYQTSSRNCPPVGCPPTCGPRCNPADQCPPYHQRRTEA
jgi:MoaA/NifB/PqqE/SkfB family radical SAM enzyme